MIIAIDIGNSQLAVGCLEETKVILKGRFTTRLEATADEYAIQIKTWLDINHIQLSSISGGIISSVVPPLTAAVCSALKELIGLTPKVVGPGIKNGLNIKIENPAQLGADMVVTSVAAIAKYPLPQIIFDFGTATTVSVIDEKAVFRGCLILPGIMTSLDALTNRTSQLPQIALTAPRSVIGRNTTDSMQSGAVYGTAAMMDGIARRIEEELKQKAVILATGWVIKDILPLCNEKIIYDEDLVLEGLGLIYQKNR